MNTKWLVFLTGFPALLFTSSSLPFTQSPALAATACRDISSVQQSADANRNTALGGHVTQHISGMQPPPKTSQKGKTLFEAKGKYDAAWRQYRYVKKPVVCVGKHAQQSVSLKDLNIKYLGAYSCTDADPKSGVCTKWKSYIATDVFFGFIYKDGKWILNTAYPVPLTK